MALKRPIVEVVKKEIFIYLFYLFKDGKRKGEERDKRREAGGIDVNEQNNGLKDEWMIAGREEGCREKRRDSGGGQGRMEGGGEEEEGASDRWSNTP